ncbi:MAG: hypothetical protein JXB48_10945 [Candidatus Latescibacteria bacterium]|nr:hypothetical protein [Candidatus Latescibacterota bacterium]
MKKAYLFVSIILTIYLNTSGEIFSARKGEIWLGGSFSAVTIGVRERDENRESDRYNIYLLGPVVRYFISDYVYVGPKLSWTKVKQGSYEQQRWAFGAEIGFAYGENGITIPFLNVSPHANLAYYDNNENYSKMFMLPFTIGLMTKMKNNIGIQLELGYHMGYHKNYYENSFSFGIGICGFGENNAISMVNLVTLAQTL